MGNIDCMVDIETLSTRHNAVVISIGACVFNRYKLDSFKKLSADEDRCFYRVLRIKEQQDEMNRHVSADTVAWWFKQSDAAKNVFSEEPTPVRQSLMDFALWTKHHGCNYFWAKDPDFDGIIMRDLFTDVGLLWPFHFWNTRSVRTTYELAFPNKEEWDRFKPKALYEHAVAHNAKDDAVAQAIGIQLSLRQLSS